MAFAAWQGASRCVGSARPGARALMAFILATHPKARNLGIYNCRSVRGGSSKSCHAEGRALDVGFAMEGGRGSKAGHALLKQLLAAGPSRLGIQTIIYDRVIYSAKSPLGRRYTGVNPHYDHLHIELTRSVAEKLTLATVKAVLGAEPAKPTKPTAPGKLPEFKPGTRILTKGDRGTDVSLLQRFLGLKDHGTFDDALARKVKDYQRMRGYEQDAAVGPITWAPILKDLGL